jgi:hypothetical protein
MFRLKPPRSTDGVDTVALLNISTCRKGVDGTRTVWLRFQAEIQVLRHIGVSTLYNFL